MSFDTLLKTMLIGTPDASFVFVNNIEVEENWKSARREVQLPSMTSAASRMVVTRMEELGVFLAGPNDYLVLKEPLDPDYRAYLEANGFALPHVLTVSKNERELDITQNILGCEKTLSALKSLPRQGCFLMPFGTSRNERELSKVSGLELSVPSDVVFEKVNSKIYSRELNARLGLPQIRGMECTTLTELISAYEQLKDKKVVVKEAMGVSGKGLAVIDSEGKFRGTLKLLQRKASSLGTDAISMVVEEWIEKQFDFNYQFVIGRDGTVVFNFVKEAIVENGTHLGHRIPSRLSPDEVALLSQAAQKIGAALSSDGYWGVVGVDGIKAADGTVYPMLEINARFNMSTYQSLLQERFLDGGDRVAVAMHFPLRLSRRISFAEVAARLAPWFFTRERPEDFLVTNFATVNAACDDNGESFRGKLFGMIFGDNQNAVDACIAAVRHQLAKLEESHA